MSKVIPDAISNYKELINCDAYYVDKTPHIKTILESTSKKQEKYNYLQDHVVLERLCSYLP